VGESKGVQAEIKIAEEIGLKVSYVVPVLTELEQIILGGS
jgi:hypothetical protein